MLSLCRIDAAFRRLYEYDPDLDVSLLSLDESYMTEEDRREYAVQARILRVTLVARIADIVKQAATVSSSLDAAVAMVEVLISTYGGYGERAGSGHKHAMQAIQLLASIYSRFDEAVDLFFDLVERSCAQGRTRGAIHANAASCADILATRMMQDYDQTLLKLISKHWNAVGQFGHWDIVRPLERIKALRDVYEIREVSRVSMLSFFKRKDATPSLFAESQKMLRQIRKQRVAQMVTDASSGRVWAPRTLVSTRSSPTLRLDRASQDSSSSESKGPDVSIKEVPVESDMALDKRESYQNVARMDAFIDIEVETKALYTITENSESCEVISIQPSPGRDSPMDSVGPFDLDKPSKTSNWPLSTPADDADTCDFDEAHLKPDWPLSTPLAPS